MKEERKGTRRTEKRCGREHVGEGGKSGQSLVIHVYRNAVTVMGTAIEQNEVLKFHMDTCYSVR